MRMRACGLSISLAVVLALQAAEALPSSSKGWTKAQIQAHTRAAVRASRAEIRHFSVEMPNRNYTLKVDVRDPAAFLKYRAGRLVDVINRLTNIRPRFRTRLFAVHNRADKRVLWVIRHAGSTRWFIEPRLEQCAENLDLNVEINPENSAPRCPA